MSGYFARLLARAQQAAPRVRPQATLAFAAPSRVDEVAELEGLAERGAAEPRDDIERVVASQAEQPRVPPAPKSERRAEAQSARAQRVAETDEAGRSVTRLEPDDRPVPVTSDRVEPRTPLAPIVRASREDAPSSAPRVSVRRDEGDSPRHDVEFRLLPETPNVAPMRNAAADRDIDHTAFARAMDEARAQIRRQLAAERTAPSEVHVTIGRIEVTTAPVAPTPKRKVSERAPAASLEQYLASRARRNP